MSSQRFLTSFLAVALLAVPATSRAGLGERSAKARGVPIGAAATSATGSAAAPTRPTGPVRKPKTPAEGRAWTARAKAVELATTVAAVTTEHDEATSTATATHGQATQAEKAAAAKRQAAATAAAAHAGQKTVIKGLRAEHTTIAGALEAAASEVQAALSAVVSAGEDGVDDLVKQSDAKLTVALKTSAQLGGLRRKLTGAVTDGRAKARAATEADQDATTHEATAAELRAAAVAAAGIAQRTTKKLTTVTTAADTVAREAADAEAHAEAMNYRYDQHFAKFDQHLIKVVGTQATRASWRAAAQRYRAASFVTSKPGEISQDSVASNPEAGLWAISDGVTNSDFSSELSRALVRRWTDKPPQHSTDVNTWLEGAQADWRAETAPKIATVKNAWYNKGSTFRADAAFVGAQMIRQKGAQRMRMVGIGDTVAFLVRGGKIRKSFPLVEAAEFSSTVKTMASAGAPDFKVREEMWDVRAGDEVFMATDALGHWVMNEVEAGRDPFPILRGIKTRGEMDRFVAAARDGKLSVRTGLGKTAARATLDVDDTSLVRFVVPPLSSGGNTKLASR